MMQMATQRPALLEQLTDHARRLADDGPEWLREIRRAASARLEAGFPTTKDESWKTTNPTRLTDVAVRLAETAPGAVELPAGVDLGLDGPRLVFVDGRFDSALSRTTSAGDGVRVDRLADVLAEEPDRLRPFFEHHEDDGGSVFAGLNSALFEDGLLVSVNAGASATRPIEVLHLTTNTDDGTPLAVFPRTLIEVAANGRATVVERYIGLGAGRSFTDAVTMSIVGDNARLDHYRVQLEGPAAHHVSRIWSHQGRDSRYIAQNINLGGAIVRNDISAVIDGEGTDCQLWGLYVTRDEQHLDNQTLLDHAKPHGDSREVYKGVLDDASRAVFNGRIIVREDAQKTDAKQSNPNIVLSNRALASTRPQLEIYADDVKCTHGATVGQLDEEQVFYLRSRGLSEPDARDLLLVAFVGEVLDRIEIESLRDLLRDQVAQRLPGATRS